MSPGPASDLTVAGMLGAAGHGAAGRHQAQPGDTEQWLAGAPRRNRPRLGRVAFLMQRYAGQCSSKVQRPRRTALTLCDRPKSSYLRQLPLSTAVHLNGKEKVYGSIP